MSPRKYTDGASFVGSQEWRAYMPWFPNLTDQAKRPLAESYCEIVQVETALGSRLDHGGPG